MNLRQQFLLGQEGKACGIQPVPGSRAVGYNAHARLQSGSPLQFVEGNIPANHSKLEFMIS